IGNIHPRFVTGTVGPLIRHAEIDYVKGFYERPLLAAEGVDPRGGGRVTEILVRPLFDRFCPELAALHQPLAGEYAARREVLETIPFPTGYGVETAHLIDVWRARGIGAIAQTLVNAIRSHGGEVRYRQEAVRIILENGRPVAVETKKGESFPADLVVANLPPWNLAKLLGDALPPRLQDLPAQPKDGWGAFMAYVGIDEDIVAPDAPLHHQVIVREPLGETNTVFLSLSPAWDSGRAPSGRRALTISTHTDLRPWWSLFTNDRRRYEQRKEAYLARMLNAAQKALPGLRDAADLVLPGTPVTFQRFTRRAWGWVGGFPQTSLTRAWGPKIGPGLWMVGDSIFPGQSTAAVALGGLRVAESVLDQAGARKRVAQPTLAHELSAGR
ncbi:MAG: FAD-dependent oxidoreductase, partial [Caldilineaceae bacterium]|nr:FAD-dependent oxidoreductase [Caldilineaceae bacterium]